MTTTSTKSKTDNHSVENVIKKVNVWNNNQQCI